MSAQYPSSSQSIVIYGIRGYAREVHQLIQDLARSGLAMTCTGFLVDHEYREASTVHDLPVWGDVSWLAEAPDVLVAVGIGASDVRYRITQRIEDEVGPRFTVLQHPRAWTTDYVRIGTGSIVGPGAMVSSEISIGRHVQLHIGCTIGHDTILGDFVTVAPGANVSGRVELGEGVFVGAGAVILPDLKVGPWTIIGAGAVVAKDVPANVTVAGIPARIIARRAEGWHRA